MAGSFVPLATTVVVVAILAATSTVSAVAAAGAAGADKYGGRMVIIRAPGASRVLNVVSAGGALDKWQRRRLVEDEVAPEFGAGGGLLAAANGGSVPDDALNKDRPVCLPSGQCAKQAGGSYTRGCTYPARCG